MLEAADVGAIEEGLRMCLGEGLGVCMSSAVGCGGIYLITVCVSLDAAG